MDARGGAGRPDSVVLLILSERGLRIFRETVAEGGSRMRGIGAAAFRSGHRWCDLRITRVTLSSTSIVERLPEARSRALDVEDAWDTDQWRFGVPEPG